MLLIKVSPLIDNSCVKPALDRMNARITSNDMGVSTHNLSKASNAPYTFRGSSMQYRQEPRKWVIISGDTGAQDLRCDGSVQKRQLAEQPVDDDGNGFKKR